MLSQPAAAAVPQLLNAAQPSAAGNLCWQQYCPQPQHCTKTHVSLVFHPQQQQQQQMSAAEQQHQMIAAAQMQQQQRVAAGKLEPVDDVPVNLAQNLSWTALSTGSAANELHDSGTESTAASPWPQSPDKQQQQQHRLVNYAAPHSILASMLRGEVDQYYPPPPQPQPPRVDSALSSYADSESLPSTASRSRSSTLSAVDAPAGLQLLQQHNNLNKQQPQPPQPNAAANGQGSGARRHSFSMQSILESSGTRRPGNKASQQHQPTAGQHLSGSNTSSLSYLAAPARPATAHTDDRPDMGAARASPIVRQSNCETSPSSPPPAKINAVCQHPSPQPIKTEPHGLSMSMPMPAAAPPHYTTLRHSTSTASLQPYDTESPRPDSGSTLHRDSESPRPTPTSTTASPLAECVVCGDKSSGYHYGVVSCEGCKGFFRRTVQKSIEYACHKHGDCAVNRLTRNRCQSCRFQKCLRQGMTKESVRMDRNRKRKPRDDETDATAYRKLLATQQTAAAVVAAHNETALAVNTGQPLPTVVEFMCEQLMQGGLRRVADFIHRVPGLMSLRADDRDTLVRHAAPEILLLRLCCVYLMQPISAELHLPHLQGFVHYIRQTRDLLLHLSVHNEELALLAAVAVMNSSCTGVQDPTAVARQQEPLLDALKLQLQLNNSHGRDPNTFAKLLMKMSEMRTMGVGQMYMGVLTSDLRQHT